MSISGYTWAMELAGAKILVEDSFGDYQGSWYAKVEFNNKVFWVHGSYGSCSGCDAFQSEVNTSHYHDDEYHWVNDNAEFRTGCTECDELKTKVKDFGLSYLKDPRDINLLLKEARERAEWDMDAKKVVEFLEKNNTEPQTFLC